MRDGHFRGRIGSGLHQHRYVQTRESQCVGDGALIAKVRKRNDHAIDALARAAKQSRATLGLFVRFNGAVLALLGLQANSFMPLRRKYAQNFFAAVACQHIGKKAPIPNDDAENAHGCRRGRNISTYSVPMIIIKPPHHTGACRSDSTVGGGFFSSASPLTKISAPYVTKSSPTKNHTGIM